MEPLPSAETILNPPFPRTNLFAMAVYIQCPCGRNSEASIVSRSQTRPRLLPIGWYCTVHSRHGCRPNFIVAATEPAEAKFKYKKTFCDHIDCAYRQGHHSSALHPNYFPIFIVLYIFHYSKLELNRVT